MGSPCASPDDVKQLFAQLKCSGLCLTRGCQAVIVRAWHAGWSGVAKDLFNDAVRLQLLTLWREDDASLDLHGMSSSMAEVALSAVLEAPELCPSHAQVSHYGLFIDAGMGSHSRGGVSVLRPVVKAFLRREGLEVADLGHRLHI